MKVCVQLFAVARQFAGVSQYELQLPDGSTIADLRTELLARIPQLEPLGRLLKFSVGLEYADDGTTIPKDAEIACIPPVSGG